MAQISDFARKFTCTVWQLLGKDKYGQVQFGAPVVINDIYYTQTNQLFKNSSGTEIMSKYKIMANPNDKEVFSEKNYIAFGDHGGAANPIDVDGHEIMSAKLVKVPFDGLNDELIVMV